MAMKPTRRGFVRGCSAAIAGLAGTRFTNLAFAAPSGDFNDEILVVVFLRGGMDGLNVVMPLGGADRGYYEAARPDLKVPVSGGAAALPLDAQLGLHPAALPLYELYQDGRLAVVVAAGLNVANRSHFDSMEFIERGTPGIKTTPTGWLTRHFLSAENLPPEIVMPSLSAGNLPQTSLFGDRDNINLSDPNQFSLSYGPWMWRNAQRVALRNLYSGGNTWLHASGLQSLDAMDIIELNVTDDYIPANGAVYPGGSFGDHLEMVAQMIKLDLGLRVTTLDLGGWDTHNGQGDGSGGYFAGLLGTLAEGLAALYTDLDGTGAANYANRLTVVVQSEFGRRLSQNDDRGTDHGHGNSMLVLSGNAIGGVHGVWPGLAPEQLFDFADLDVTTDFRRVLSEILIRRMGNPSLGVVFPGYTDYSPLGVVTGADLPPDYSGIINRIYRDSFESGTLTEWDAATMG
jgi:uncharacterized protein (DUF1501 family)